MNSKILKEKKVLVAEDCSINQMLVKHALSKLEAITDLANDGLQAIEKFKKNDYDLILLDIQLPHLTGYEVTAIIRNQLKSEIPVFAMSAFILDSRDKEYVKSGMNGYILKPFTAESLSNTIEKDIYSSAMTSNTPYILENNNVCIDISMLYDISGNDEDYINLMVKTFLEKMPDNLQKIEQGIKSQDWENVYKAAHYAKSPLSIVKISDMFDRVLQIEVNAKDKINLSTMSDLIKKIKEEYHFAEGLLNEKFPAK